MSSRAKNKTFTFLLFLVVFLSLFTRFFNLDWGNTFFFHPDENNMVNAILQMDKSNLNPHFFAYGQFPLYLTFFTTLRHQFSNIALSLRFWSALFSTFSILFFYLIVDTFLKNRQKSLLATLLFIFTPGLIQASHFGTTESILVFVFLVNTFLSLKIFDKFKIKYLILASLVSAIGIASKISSLILITPIFLSLFLIFLKDKKLFSFFKNSLFFISLTLLLSLIFSPFNFLDFTSFYSSISYEISVASGKIPIFYTRQFIGTVPYLFQFQKIFPFTIGIPILFLSLLGIFNLPKKSRKILLVLIPSLIFFLYQGQLFTKWTRFMTPLFFIFPFLSAFFIKKIKNKVLLLVVVLLSIVPGLLFMQTYIEQDLRIQASLWLNTNIPSNSIVLSESGNVVTLPVFKNDFQINNFNFYELDNSPILQKELNKSIQNSNYILVPSRRVFKNHNSSTFPKTKKYYQELFSHQLNFSEIKKFNLKTTLILDPENAEETWTVFDNPTIRVYKKDTL